jgi:hypothetical protein
MDSGPGSKICKRVHFQKPLRKRRAEREEEPRETEGKQQSGSGTGPALLPEQFAGPDSDKVDATSVILEFFEKHRREKL